MSGVHDDPFNLGKAEVQKAVDEIGAIFARWETLLENTNTADNNNEFEFASSELTEQLTHIKEDLSYLEKSVSIVEKDQKKYGLDDVDVQQRKDFIRSTKKRIAEIHSKIESPATQAKIDRDRKMMLTAGTQGMNAARDLRGDLAIAQETEDQRLLMSQQDDVMDEIHAGAVRLHEVSQTMNTELKDQVNMLADVQENTGNLATRLSAANNKVTDLIENTLSIKQKLCLIVVLVITFLILTFLVFYT